MFGKVESEIRYSFQDRHLFSKHSLGNCGFQIATEGNIARQLPKIIPTGEASALYDAIIKSLTNILHLHLMIDESKNEKNWRLVIIIICSGPDTCSKANLEDVRRTYNMVKNQMKVQKLFLKIIAYNIGDMSDAVINELASIEPDEDSIIYHASNNYQNNPSESIGELMKKIRNNIGLRSDHNNKDQQRALHFAINFTIPGLQKNKGKAWQRLCTSINTFTRYLGQEDLMGATIYSNKLHHFWGNAFYALDQEKSLRQLPIQPGLNAVGRPQKGHQRPPEPEYFVDVLHPIERVDRRLLQPNGPLNQSSSSVLQAPEEGEGGFYFITDIQDGCRKCCATILVLLVVAFFGGCIFIALY